MENYLSSQKFTLGQGNLCRNNHLPLYFLTDSWTSFHTCPKKSAISQEISLKCFIIKIYYNIILQTDGITCKRRCLIIVISTASNRKRSMKCVPSNRGLKIKGEKGESKIFQANAHKNFRVLKKWRSTYFNIKDYNSQ